MLKKVIIFIFCYLNLVSNVFAEAGREKEINDSIKKLENREEQIRIDAANSLGFLEDKRAVSYLINVLEDNNLEVKKAAILALGNLGDKTAIPHLKKFLQDPSLSWSAAYSLGMLGDEGALDALTSYLKDKNITKRKFTVYAISGITSVSAIKILNSTMLIENSREVKEEIEKILNKSNIK
ncbi:MAG: HEAT repeat domain-containing protein [Candidatus Omnitrophica bacterium]|nr:HEAT repeat domain-containing protein [Candidatus Omnitrophota bacterium]